MRGFAPALGIPRAFGHGHDVHGLSAAHRVVNDVSARAQPQADAIVEQFLGHSFDGNESPKNCVASIGWSAGARQIPAQCRSDPVSRDDTANIHDAAVIGRDNKIAALLPNLRNWRGGFHADARLRACSRKQSHQKISAVDDLIGLAEAAGKSRTEAYRRQLPASRAVQNADGRRRKEIWLDGLERAQPAQRPDRIGSDLQPCAHFAESCALLENQGLGADSRQAESSRKTCDAASGHDHGKGRIRSAHQFARIVLRR